MVAEVNAALANNLAIDFNRVRPADATVCFGRYILQECLELFERWHKHREPVVEVLLRCLHNRADRFTIGRNPRTEPDAFGN